MSHDRIDFISAYCDRWCERCAFTDRCAAYAVDIATEMCGGDVEAGLELAVGPPAIPGAPHPTGRPEAVRDLPDEQELEADVQAYAREREARDARIDESPITTMTTVVMMLGRKWLEERRERATANADTPLREAIETVGWDACFIPAKLRRALNGRDAAKRGEGLGDDHPVQNDWNGSAKVALISIDRSHAAWLTIGKATGDPEAVRLADELGRLRDAVNETFPHARRFIRPGFDDGGRRRRWWW